MNYFHEEGEINLDTYSFTEWVKFVFDHPVEESEWYWQAEWEHWGTPEHLLPFITRLCKHPEFLLDTYSLAQIEAGFWLLPIPHNLHFWLWDTTIAWRLRKKCIYAMAELYRRLFAKHTWKDIDTMWWDLIVIVPRMARDKKARTAMLNAMTQVLHMPEPNCQKGALWGLGPLSHPRKYQIMRRHLLTHPEIEAELNQYARRALAGRRA